MKQFENGYPYHDIFQWIAKDIFHFFQWIMFQFDIF